jgi:hypothetical protein
MLTKTDRNALFRTPPTTWEKVARPETEYFDFITFYSGCFLINLIDLPALHLPPNLLNTGPTAAKPRIEIDKDCLERRVDA